MLSWPASGWKQEVAMPIDAEVEAAVAAMRSVRTTGAKVHEEVLRAYAIAAVQAAENARVEDFVRRAGSIMNRMQQTGD
jgi:type IV secretory pathway TrbF-like protein